jgi:hypothetical protein
VTHTHTKHAIQLYSAPGRLFNPWAVVNGEDSGYPDATIAIEDIARSLSMQCRYLGHVKKFYSVAEHSVRVSRLCDPKDALAGLLHDAAEAYLGDVPAPYKRHASFAAYVELEENLRARIFERFGLLPDLPASVKLADREILATEVIVLKHRSHPVWSIDVQSRPACVIAGYQPQDAEMMFLREFRSLTEGKGV